MEDLLELARVALKEALRAGADQADVSLARGHSLEVEVLESAVSSCELRQGVTASVRAFHKGGCGLHVCHGLEKGDMVFAARAAASAARATGEDPDFRTLPAPEPAGVVEGLYDEWVDSIDVSEAAALARQCVERALAVASDANVSGSLSFISSEGAFANSLGVSSAERATSASADMMVLVKRGGAAGSYADFSVGRRREDVDLPSAGERAALGALRYLGPRGMKGGRMALVSGPLTSGGFLESLARAACAESIQRGRSFLGGNVGGRVGPGFFTLIDDGRFPAGLHSSSRDGEGTPRQRMTVFEKGVFSGMLHNSYTAGKAGVRSTGHGSQLGGIAPTNLRPELGLRTAEEIIADIDEGIYVDSSFISPHPVSGDISSTLDWAIKIERGELAYPVSGVAVYGNALEMLRSLREISSDYRAEPGSVLPTMVFDDVQVVAGGQ